jgi:Flp pilus assembly protein TadG
MHRSVQTITAMRRRLDGIAALEFALLAPLMIYTLLVATDIGNALSITRRLTNAADTIAELVSQQTSAGVIVGGPNDPVVDANLIVDFNSIITTFPDALADAAGKGINWQADIQPIISNVVFGPGATCVVSTTNPPIPAICTTASVTWSVGFANAGTFTTTRSCGKNTLTEVSSNAYTPSLTTLPPGVYSPNSLVVVDVTYVFTPTFTAWLTGPFTFSRTAYLPPRFFTQLSYLPTATSTAGAASAAPLTNCQYTGALP